MRVILFVVVAIFGGNYFLIDDAGLNDCYTGYY